MLDLSQSEVISRADLFEASSAPTTASLTTLIKPSTFLWDLNFGDEASTEQQPSSPKSANVSSPAESNDEAKEYQFRLFSTKSAKAQTFVVPKSPPPISLKPEEEKAFEQVYFTDEQIEDARQRFRSMEYYIRPATGNESTPSTVAVSGDDIKSWSQTKWKACQKPWRVLHLRVVPKPLIVSSKSVPNAIHGIPVGADARKRHRPNKKRRIMLRKKRAVVEEKKQKTEAKKAAKKKTKAAGKASANGPVRKLTDEEEKAKKTRLNRLKKVRRKMKLQAENVQETT